MKVLYVTGGFFPTGSAYASRTLNISRSLRSKGHDVYVLADYSDKDVIKCSEVQKIYGIEYVTAFESKCTVGKKRIESYLELLKGLLKQNRFDVAICASDHDRFKLVFKELRLNHIPVILESCEWFGYNNWKCGIINPRYYKFLVCWHKCYKDVDGVIAISRVLQEHYSRYCKNVIRFPTVLPSGEYEYCTEINVDGVIKLIYAGSAGKSKDLLANIILAIKTLNRESIGYTLDIYGVSEELVRYQLGSNAGELDGTSGFVFIHGHVLQTEINACYKKCDYSVLLRPQRRSSQAGFPTKLAESMMAGTPIICNATGDIELYVKSGENGIVINNCKIDTIKEALKSVKAESADSMKKMRASARRTAENSFDFNIYSGALDELLKKVVVRN